MSMAARKPLSRWPVLAGAALLWLISTGGSASTVDAGADLTPPVPAPSAAEPPDQARPDAALTAKERLGAKAQDEQRLDDCKVPEAARTRPRPFCPEPDAEEAVRP